MGGRGTEEEKKGIAGGVKRERRSDESASTRSGSRGLERGKMGMPQNTSKRRRR